MKFGIMGLGVKPSVVKKKGTTARFSNSNILNTTQTEQGNDTTVEHNQHTQMPSQNDRDISSVAPSHKPTSNLSSFIKNEAIQV